MQRQCGEMPVRDGEKEGRTMGGKRRKKGVLDERLEAKSRRS